MLLARLADASAALAATRSRLAKRAVIAEVVAAAEPAEIAVVVSHLAGSLRQRRTGVGWAALGSLPDPAAEPGLTVAEVDAAFEKIAGLAGPGSAARRADAVRAVFARATASEQPFLRALVFGEVRQGALDAVVQDGVAQAFGVPVAAVRRAAMFLGSTPAVAGILAAHRDDPAAGLAELERLTIQVGLPVRPMLAASAPDAAGAVAKSGLPAVVDTKLDGIRVQVHHGPGGTALFTRSLDEITDRLPEVVEAVRALPAVSVVLDGEVVGVGPDGRPLPFQVIASRTGSSLDPEAGRRQTPLSLFCFDVLHLDGEDLIDRPLTERDAVLRRLVPADLLVPRTVAETTEQVQEAFDAAVAQGYEGAVVKDPAAPYAAGRRDSGWVKVKPRHTLDLAVIGAEWGYGRREGKLSNLHLAARGADGELVMLGKTFKGLTDVLLAWQTEEFQARAARRTKAAVFIDPPLVAEIALDGVQRSTRYPGGVALRFARVLRYRPDKTPDEIDSLVTVLALHPVAAETDGAEDDGGDEES